MRIQRLYRAWALRLGGPMSSSCEISSNPRRQGARGSHL
jgi:hypothetical protein